jgi:hypothetical protein
LGIAIFVAQQKSKKALIGSCVACEIIRPTNFSEITRSTTDATGTKDNQGL